jgi:hypothetical protein
MSAEGITGGVEVVTPHNVLVENVAANTNGTFGYVYGLLSRSVVGAAPYQASTCAMHEGTVTVKFWVELAARDEEAISKSFCVESHPGWPTAMNISYDERFIGALQLVWFVSVNDAVLVPTEIDVKLTDPFWRSVSNWLGESVQDVGVVVAVVPKYWLRTINWRFVLSERSWMLPSAFWFRAESFDGLLSNSCPLYGKTTEGEVAGVKSWSL